MIDSRLSRRSWLAAAAGTFVLADGLRAGDDEEAPKESPFGYCMNTSTIRGGKLPIAEEVELVAAAGYDGIEPWVGELQRHAESGGSLKDLGKRIADAGLTVCGAIGFAPWIVDDDGERAKGLEQAKREMDMVRQIGGDRMAAPPAGATREAGLNLNRAAERYRTLLEAGDSIGVWPIAEVWGFSANMSRLGEAVLVAVESGHPKATVLPDVYHMYKGGSPFEGLRLLSGDGIGLFHINDYPDIPRERINDSDRVYPGDGVAPLGDILRTLRRTGYRGMLSLELFNPEYEKRDPKEVAAAGLAGMRRAVESAFGEG